MKSGGHSVFNQHKLAPTGIFSSFIPVDKAGDEYNEGEESDGTHQADKPALG